jgi:hypothetical protein
LSIANLKFRIFVPTAICAIRVMASISDDSDCRGYMRNIQIYNNHTMLLWWRRIDELLGMTTGQLMRKLVSSLNNHVNDHFDDPETAEDIIRIVFIEYGQLMEYGKAVHDGIRAERRVGPRQPKRVARATRAALELIKTPASTDDGDINAVIPLVSSRLAGLPGLMVLWPRLA